MTRTASAKKKRKRQSTTPKPLLEAGSDSDGAIGDHPDTNAINRTLSNLYMTSKGFSTPSRDMSMKEDKEESKADEEIEKALKKKARLKEKYLYQPSEKPTTFEDLGGLDNIINDLIGFFDPEQQTLEEIGFSKTKRILISGVAGVGKSKLVEGIVNHAANLPIKLASVKCPIELISGSPSDVVNSCKSLFNFARSMQPCLLIIDRLDHIFGKSDESRTTEIERQIKTDIFIESLEELNKENAEIHVIGITRSIDALDYSFMSTARFTKKIHIDVPDDKTRGSILKVLCKNIKISHDVKFDELGSKTPGYVGADLWSLVAEAGIIADVRLRGEMKNSNDPTSQESSMDIECNNKKITLNDFYIALRRIKPSLKRDGFASIPNVTWADIGACDHIRKKLMATILLPVKYPTFMEKTLRGKASCGILLHGPPGCGKTSIAKAIANEGDISFISVKGPEVLNKYVGESERKIRDIFDKAAKAKPCVIFFDEIDALCTERAASERSNVTQSVLSQILTEMDGFENQSCLVLAATNRLDVLDSAILRPGRFDNHIFVGIPDAAARLDILKAITRNNIPPLSPDVCLKTLAHDDRLKNFTGADLRGLIERAHSNACIEMSEKIGALDEGAFLIKKDHIESALHERGASISDQMLEFYLKSARKFGLTSS